MELIVSIIGAITAIMVSIIGALIANKNSSLLQIRKLKEQHYISYIEALHNLAANTNHTSLSEYTFFRDKLFVVASEAVVRDVLKYEKEAVGRECELHDFYLTAIIKSIRKDLKIRDKNFPQIYLKKA